MTFSFCLIEIVYLLNRNSPFALPQPPALKSSVLVSVSMSLTMQRLYISGIMHYLSICD